MITRVSAATTMALAVSLTVASPAHASAEQLCGEVGGKWTPPQCTVTVQSQRKATLTITVDLAPAVLENRSITTELTDYYRALFAGWTATGRLTPRDGNATATATTHPGPGSVENLIVHETFAPAGVQPNNAYRSFVFDNATGRQLALPDLFKAGIDPYRAVTDAAGPTLQAALDAAPPPHLPNTYPFTAEHWQPGSHGPGFSGDYRAFALTTDGLILYMPDQPMQREEPTPERQLAWSMDGGTITLTLPLSALSPLLRPQYGGTP
ncbi:DUF3298 domain-containing protein [Arthrobacter sp. SLBN-53]|uniref:DUF3298 domain-containing protein n=1 Tax=Arthrobacter sp. SLBN-53 TaxID=2768412 RepID=UPI0011524714|nr:DUF3298 domain-containing protein [Arthrobacter sp. SLBN-53]TQK32053.1 hypothetical protein FBY28_5099 [Arthrobacter sp. SLBN-53]